MRLDVYQQETAQQAQRQQAVLADVQRRLQAGDTLSRLEQNGVLHVLQVLIENAIGKAKHWLKAKALIVPVSAYDAFAALADAGLIAVDDLPAWNAAIGLRNRIVHDYMNLDFERVAQLVKDGAYRHVTAFLMREYPAP